MKTLKSTILAISVMTCATAAATNPGLEIMHPGNAHTLVRITDPKPLLLLPVEEAMPDSRIDILVNGVIAQTIYVRLALNTTDYTVPLDLQPYTRNGNVLLSISTPHDREYSRDAKNNACWQGLCLTDTYDKTNVEDFRPAYHHTPQYGWMNDPNGMFYKDGQWHLYYQYNPYGSKWQNMTWGHSVSTDLVHWSPMPNAIEPNGLGTIFSGSCVVDHANSAGFGADEVIALYTSADRSQLQSMAFSGDNGATFTNYAGNPVIVTANEARDPNMFWNESIGKWSLSLAGAMEHEMLFFSSPDLKDWTYESSFGKGYGSQDGVWECPDLFSLDIDGQQKWVLLCNINPGGKFGGSATQYFVGDFDGHHFTSDYAPTDTMWMDYGKDHYAAVTWSNAPDNRRVAIAWMSNWEYANEVPTTQFRSANTLPRDLSLFRAPDGKIRLASTPSPEVNALRKSTTSYGSMNVSAKGRSFKLPVDGLCEITLDYDVPNATSLTLTLANKKGEKVDMTIDAATLSFMFDRTKSGITNFSHSFPAITQCELLRTRAKGQLRIFIDRCSVEVFDSEGRFAMTNLVFPTEPYNILSIKSEHGKARVNNLNVYSLK